MLFLGASSSDLKLHQHGIRLSSELERNAQVRQGLVSLGGELLDISDSVKCLAKNSVKNYKTLQVKTDSSFLRELEFQIGIKKPIPTGWSSNKQDLSLDRPHWKEGLLKVLNWDDLKSGHDPNYINKLQSSEKELEKLFFNLFDLEGSERFNKDFKKLSWRDLVEKFFIQTQGTFLASQMALQGQNVYFIGGGFHHAMASEGRGFCLLNDLVISLVKLKQENPSLKAWVVDVDAHKGDGTAAMTVGLDWVRTLSVHMKDSWPLEGPPKDSSGKLFPWFIPSDIDIEISKGNEDEYLTLLQAGLEELKNLDSETPDLVLVVHGADPFEGDELESTQDLRLSLKQMLERDRLLYQFFRTHSIPQAYTMAGGYGANTASVYLQFFDEVISGRLDS